MEIKFKVGDKVRSNEFDCTGVVKNVDANKLSPYQVEIIEIDWVFTFWFTENELELINE